MSLAIRAFAPEPLFTRRAHRQNMARAAKALSAISLGAAFVLTTGEAGALSSRASGEEGFSPINGTPLGFNDDGDLIVLLADGKETVIPRGEYGLVGDQIVVSDMIEGIEVAQNGYIPPTSGVPVYGGPGPMGLGYASWAIPLGIAAVGVLAYLYLSRSNNEAPAFASTTYTASFDENDNGTVVSTPATDAEGDTITYSLSDTDAGQFSIDTSGNITFKSKPNEEAPGDAGRDNVYNLTVTATDDHGEASSSVVTVTVTDDDADYQADATATLTSLSAGNDDVTASGTITGFDAGAGNDAVDITGTMASGTGDMGTGNDHLTISNDLGAGSVTFDMDTGNDWFELDSGTQAGTITVDLGTGSDVVDIDAAITGTTAKLVIEAMGTDDIIDLRALNLSEGVNTTIYSSLALAVVELDDYDVVFWDNGADLQMVIDADENDDMTLTGDAGDMFIDLDGIQTVTAAMFDLS